MSPLWACALLGSGLLASGCARFGYDILASKASGDAGVGGAPPGTGGDARPTPTPDECAASCRNDNGSASCASGSCLLTCEAGYADCDQDPSNGCEANTAQQTSSCGSCDLECTNPNGAALCQAGLCAPTCAPGYADCDEDPTNGCEQALDALSHCGGCGSVCAASHATATCSAGSCVLECAAGFGDCDGDASNGCEADLSNDPSRCGSCATRCEPSLQICAAGSCAASPCDPGRGECGGEPALLGETDLQSSAQHCGFCANACSVANGTAACSAGSCTVSSCATGFGDCDGSAGNGCEAAFASSEAHCGACGRACTNPNGNTRCEGGSCTPTCATGFADCDGNPDNGCETSLGSVSHCGACGDVCTASEGTPTCNAGVCGTRCDLSGTFALKLTASGSWPANQYTSAGSGTFLYWLKVNATHSGATLNASVTECGRTMPPVSAVGETILFGFPNSLFDGGFLPSSSASVSLGSSSPGASVSWPSTVTLMGVTLADPGGYSWPSSATSIPSGSRVDMDGDGKPGVTGFYANGSGHDYPRVAMPFLFTRADLAYVASRLAFSLSGTLTSCSASTGSASITRVDRAIFGCNRANSTADCSSGEADNLDGAQVAWGMDATTYALQRVASGAGCAAVRAALP